MISTVLAPSYVANGKCLDESSKIGVMNKLGIWHAKVRENLFISCSTLPGLGRVSGTFQPKSGTIASPFPSLVMNQSCVLGGTLDSPSDVDDVARYTRVTSGRQNAFAALQSGRDARRAQIPPSSLLTLTFSVFLRKLGKKCERNGEANKRSVISGLSASLPLHWLGTP